MLHSPNEIFHLIHELSKKYLPSSFVERYFPKTRANRNILWGILIGSSVTTLSYQIWSARQGIRRYFSSLSDRVIENWEIEPTKRSFQDTVLFFKKFIKLGKILIPHSTSVESRRLVVLTILLLLRTLLAIKLADVTGKNAQYLVQIKWDDTIRGILEFAALGIPASCLNSWLQYETKMLSLDFKNRLSKEVHNQYLSGVTMYTVKQIQKLGGNYEVPNVDADITRFCDELAKSYTTILKPILDIILFALKLGSVIGYRGPAVVISYYSLVALIRRYLLPSFSKLKTRESLITKQYQASIFRFVQNAEEIGFYGRTNKERTLITKLLNDLYETIAFHSWLQAIVGVFEDFLSKYMTSISGYLVLGFPYFFPTQGGQSSGDLASRTMNYVRNRQLLVSLGEAFVALMIVPRKLKSLYNGLMLVTKLFDMAHQREASGVKPFERRPSDDFVEQYPEQDERMERWLADWKRAGDNERARRYERQPLRKENKQIIEGQFIKFENVSIIAPNGLCIVENLNFTLKPGQNILITGSAGSGKTSLFRILGELWPVNYGTLVKPRKEDILFVPQNPYFVIGTLRDQLIYPHNIEDMKNLNVTDDDLNCIMEIVDPAKTILSQWKWDDVNDWFGILPLVQKQRLAIARLFYHRPLFAMLDQSTSMLCDEVVSKIYETCKELGITLLTVSHRPLAKRFHDYSLRFAGYQGKGAWEWSSIPHEKEQIKK